MSMAKTIVTTVPGTLWGASLGLLFGASAAFGQTASEEEPYDGPFYLRGSIFEATVFGAPERSPEARAKNPFQLSYSRDDLKDTETVTVKGALFAYFPTEHTNRGNLRRTAYTMGVELDQTRVDGRVDEDLVTYHLGGSWLWTSDNPQVNWSTHVLSGSTKWLTDTDNELSVAVGGLSYTPQSRSCGFAGAYCQSGGGAFGYRLTPTLLVDYLNVNDAAGVEKFEGEAERLYVGGRLEAAGLWLDGPLKGTSITAEYQYFSDVLGNEPDLEYWKASVNLPLTDTGTASLNVGYEEGETPTQPEKEGVTVSVGFAF